MNRTLTGSITESGTLSGTMTKSGKLIGTLQTSGQPGPQGPQGPVGPQGPPGPMGSYTAGEGIDIDDDTISVDLEDYTLNNEINLYSKSGITLDADDNAYRGGSIHIHTGNEPNVEIAADDKIILSASNGIFVNNKPVGYIDDTKTTTTNTWSANKVNTELSDKQDQLAAGSNIQINNNTISATDTTYTAGSNIQINNQNVISATDTTYTAGTNIQIESGTISATDTTYTNGNGIDISNDTISIDLTNYITGSDVIINSDGNITLSSSNGDITLYTENGGITDGSDNYFRPVDDTSTTTNNTWSANKINTEFGYKENTSNKVTSISSASTNTQYPSAKAVYDIVGNIESLLEALR